MLEKNKNLEKALDYWAYGLFKESRQTRTIRNQIKKIKKAIKAWVQLTNALLKKAIEKHCHSDVQIEIASMLIKKIVIMSLKPLFQI